MGDDVELKQEWSTDRTWYRYADSRPPKKTKPPGSQTVGGRWFYGPNNDLDIRFEEAPERGWAVWFREQRVGFSAGDSISAAKRKAVELLSQIEGEKAGT
jgi:hypothetical protein